MTPEIINLLRLPGEVEPPRLKAFEALNGRVITGAVVSANGSSWAPVLDGVVAFDQISEGTPPASAESLREVGIPRPLFFSHREWISTADPEIARVPFGSAATRLLAEAGILATRLERGATVVVTGDDSGWSACSVAALLPDQTVIGAIDAAGPLGSSGCRRWLAASDAPDNLTLVVSDAKTHPVAIETAAAVIDVTALEPWIGNDPPTEADPEVLHALIDPLAPIDLNRASIGERLLTDTETKALYWASRAASVARTAVRMGRSSAEIAEILAVLQAEGFVRVQRLPAAMARLHVFFSRGIVLLPVAEQTLGTIAKFSFRYFADRVFLHNAVDRSAMTFGEAAFVITRTATALYRQGVRCGDPVCVHALPHGEVPILFWACVHLGAVFVPISSSWSREVATSVLERCRPKLLFVNDEIADRVPVGWQTSAIRLDPAGETANSAAGRIVFSDWLGEVDDENDQLPATHAGPDDPAVILFTSGTTGVPKGVLLSNAAMVNFSLFSSHLVAMGIEDVFFTIVESVSPQALRDGILSSVMCGGATVISDPIRRGNVLGLADICRTYGVTIFKTVPATLNLLGQCQDRLVPGTFKTLRQIFSGSSPLHHKTLNAIGALCSAQVADQMGGTEAPAILTSDMSLTRSSIFAHGGVPYGAIAQTVDDQRRVIRDGALGRLRYYSDRLMIGYLDDPKQTAEVMQDGWFYTGDMGRWERDERLHISGRAVEMIKSAWGDKVFPGEIERALMADKRTREVAACGFTGSDGIERIAAFVIPSSTPEDPDRLIENLKNRVREALGDSKVPSVVVLVDDMPRLSREKVNKKELVTRYLQL